MKKKNWALIGMVLVALLVFMVVGNTNTSGTHGELATAEGESLSASGTILLKVNPEIAIEYNEEGLVTRLAGKNEDGNRIVDDYSDYIGKESGFVLEELIALMHEAGYFVEEVEGESRRIVLELEAGSTLPQDDFLDVLSMNIQKAVANLSTEAEFVSEEEPVQNKDEKAAKPEVKVEEKAAEQPKAQKTANKEKAQAEYIGMDHAKQIALNHAGVETSQVHWEEAEFDHDDGVPSYELEFDAGSNEYEYDIHAVSGALLVFEQDLKAAKNPEPSQAKAPEKQEAAAKKQEPVKKQVPAETKPAVNKEITKDEAITIALNHAGLTRADVVFDDVELDHDDGRKEWEIEFESGHWEFEYEIDASNGKIIDFEKEFDD